MSLILTEIIGLFRKEKIYLFFLVLVVCFYAFIFLFHRSKASNQLEERNKQQIEALLREAPQPNVIQERLSHRPILWWLVQVSIFFSASAIAVGVWFAFSDFKHWRLRREWIPASDKVPDITWGVSEIIKVILLFFVAGIAFNLTLAFLKSIFFRHTDVYSFLILHTAVLDVITVFLIIFFVKKSGAQLKDLIGFNYRKIPFREMWWGIRT